MSDPLPSPIGVRNRDANTEQHLLRRYPAITLSMAAAAGIHGGVWSWPFALLAMLVAIVLLGVAKRRGVPRLGWIAALCCVAAGFCLHSSQQQQAIARASLNHHLRETWQPAVMRLVIDSRVERRPSALAKLRRSGPQWQSIFNARVTGLRVGADWQPVTGGVRVNVDGDATAFLPGDEVEVLGNIQAIPPPRNPGAPDMRPIYSARQQQGRVRVDSVAQLRLLDSHFQLQRPFAAFGSTGEKILLRFMGEDSGPLAAALVLGRREAVDRRQRDRLLETGTAHLLSVSGLHLGMVALATSWLLVLSNLTLNKQYLIILTVCILYAALTGGRPPVMRAALLVGAVLLGMWSGRMVHPLNALALAGLLLLVWNPANLTQIGVQLSFLAVATLIFASRSVSALAAAGQAEDPLDRLIDARLGSTRRMLRVVGRKAVVAFRFSFWVWAVSAPLVWYQFHIVSPISVLANVLLGLPLMLALIAGLLAVVVGVFWAPLAAIPAAVCDASLAIITTIIDALASIPGGHLWLPAPPSWWTLAFYLILAGGLLLPKTWPRAKLLLGWSVIWLVIALPLATVYRSHYRHGLAEHSLEATFVDVGHGTSVLMRHGDGRVWLYDCGRLGDPVESSRPIESVLWDRGIVRLDAIVVSHADSDHYNGLPGLLQRFYVGQIITPPGMLDTAEPGLDEVREAIQKSGVPVVSVHARVPLHVRSDTSPIAVLHPPQQRIDGSDNANSLVLQIDHGGRTFVLPGDIELPGTETLLRVPRPPGNGILMAPHHGSLQQDIRPLLDWARPRTVVVSGGKRAGRQAVLEQLGQNGADVYVTALQGAVTTRIDGDGTVTVTPWLPEPMERAEGF